MPCKLISWDPSWGPVSEQNMKRQLAAAGFEVSRYHYPAGTYFPPHTHDVHKRDTVLSGALKISWEGDSAILRAGDMIEIPAGTMHSAEVIGAEAVVSLDATKEPEG